MRISHAMRDICGGTWRTPRAGRPGRKGLRAGAWLPKRFSGWTRWWRVTQCVQDHGQVAGPKGDGLPADSEQAALSRLEAVLFAASQPLSSRRLAEFATLADGTQARTLIRRLNGQYERDGSALRVEEVAGGFQLLTRAAYDRWIRKLRGAAEQVRLSQPALETLTIIAYRQPVLRAELEAIRGVQCGEILKQLLERDLVRICGRSNELGRPFQYGTTRKFLQVFGLRSLEALPRPKPAEPVWQAAPGAAQPNQLAGPIPASEEEPTVKTALIDPTEIERLPELWGEMPEVGAPLPLEWLPDSPDAPRAAKRKDDDDLDDDDLEADLDDEDLDDEDLDDEEDEDEDEEEDWEDLDDEGIEDVDWEDEDDDWEDEDDEDDDDWEDEEEEDWEEDED